MYSTGYGSPYPPKPESVTEAVRKTAREEVERAQREREKNSSQTRFIKVFRTRPTSFNSPGGSYYGTFDYEDMREVDDKIGEQFGGGNWRAEIWENGRKKEGWVFTTEGQPLDKKGQVIKPDNDASFEDEARGLTFGEGQRQNNSSQQVIVIAEKLEQRDREIEKQRLEIAQLKQANMELTLQVKSVKSENARIEEDARRRIERIEVETNRRIERAHFEAQLAAQGKSGDSQLTHTLLQLAFQNNKQASPVEMVGQMRELIGLANDLKEENGGESSSLESVLGAIGPIAMGLREYFQKPAEDTSEGKRSGQSSPSSLPPPEEPDNVPEGCWTSVKFTELLNEGLSYQPDPEAWAHAALAEVTVEGRQFLAAQKGSEGLDSFATKIPGLDAGKLLAVLNDPQHASAKHWLVMALSQLKRRCQSA